MANAAGVSLRSAQGVWMAHVRIVQGKRFVEKFADVVGLFIDPPARAVALSIDEKLQIQVLDCTLPGLPTKKGRGGTMTHDYKRHGTHRAPKGIIAIAIFWRSVRRWSKIRQGLEAAALA